MIENNPEFVVITIIYEVRSLSEENFCTFIEFLRKHQSVYNKSNLQKALEYYNWPIDYNPFSDEIIGRLRWGFSFGSTDNQRISELLSLLK